MKLRINRFLFFILFAGILYSCSKSGTTPFDPGGGNPGGFNPTDTIAPQITINTPAASQNFNNGNTISITGKVTDDYGLYRGSIKVVNDANGMVLQNQLYEIHGFLLYNFSLNHLATTSVVADYTITVSFEDHGNNSSSRSVKIKVNP